MKSLIAFTFAALATSLALADPTGDPQYKHPVIKDHGGIVELPGVDHQPKRDSKVVLDITSDKKEGGVLLGFDRAGLILNQYTAAGAGVDNGFKMTLILHGPATKAALSHEGYARHTSSYKKDLGKTRNPNLELIQKLTEAGVDIYVCGQALAHHGYATSDVASPVKIAVSAATLNINVQMDGYAYIPFK
ncbi:DsrE/DsrF-like family protein [Maioricimonas rarisocia]|uniref:DsrE/DsrF-like family protein n=1 Tax=Maioricimonas rarisocia TaxID=2528026 RepID=A0A517Z4K6_9PLAN|nr:DsrE family protein [Maioricimonas rarisocia]QDU37367.1 DsrE/DsrF-like family protein [Maioricimonas rarisocia]